MKAHTPQHVALNKRPTKQIKHSGSWKIAYADFMTAMMALFLLMWIMSSATEEQRHQLAGYFNSTLISDYPFGEKFDHTESIIPGGGNDYTQSEGIENIDLISQERLEFEAIKHKIDTLIRSDPYLRLFKTNLLMTITHNGLLIQFIDTQDRPMFAIGDYVPKPHLVSFLQKLAPLLNDLPQRITLTGHTDSLPYAKGEVGYSNWELSADRANAARQTLVAAGLNNGKVLQIIGVANNKSIVEKQSNSSLNRRITLMILTNKRETEIQREENIVTKISTIVVGDKGQASVTQTVHQEP